MAQSSPREHLLALTAPLKPATKANENNAKEHAHTTPMPAPKAGPSFFSRASRVIASLMPKWGRIRTTEVDFVQREAVALVMGSKGKGKGKIKDQGNERVRNGDSTILEQLEKYGRVRQEVDHKTKDGRVVKVSVRRSARGRLLLTST